MEGYRFVKKEKQTYWEREDISYLYKLGRDQFYRPLNQKQCDKSKAYIPLQRKTICFGSLRWLRPPTPQFRFGYTGYMLVSKNAKICVTPNAKPKIGVTPNAKTSNASQWNIGGIGPSGVGAGVGHVDFLLFMLISFALVTQWNMGLIFCKIYNCVTSTLK